MKDLKKKVAEFERKFKVYEKHFKAMATQLHAMGELIQVYIKSKL